MRKDKYNGRPYFDIIFERFVKIGFLLTISIIIVNYNVKFFLEQCLHSVRRAAENIHVQVIVLDNQSTDGSLEYLRPRFPEVSFILNEENLGFGKACNKGLEYATGRYILYLNPDTLLAEDTLEKCMRFFESHPDAGALGVRMIDGAGKFLKESKRSFPSPQTSLFKLLGLARLFPHSKIFGRYHLGHLDAHQNHEVDVLAGAFMFIKREVLDAVGAFDEDFFMYGEDVDLSYRIQEGGYKNYYLAQTEIIHFKGESTKKGSLNYVRMFYSAMSTFVKKHYGGSRAIFFNVSIQAAIWLRAVLSAAAKFLRWVGLPVIDAIFILLSFLAVKQVWTSVIKPDYHYPDLLLQIALPAFTLIYLVVAYYAGLYDRQFKQGKIIRSTFIATMVLLALYALLPEQYRFSRGIIVFGALLSFLCISLLRRLLVKNKYLYQPVTAATKPYILVAGNHKEYKEIKVFLQKKGLHTKLIGYLWDGKEKAIGSVKETDKIAAALNAQEIIFCAGAMSYKKIIALIQKLKQPLRLRFHAAESCSIVGSDSTNAAGEAISSEENFSIALPPQRRAKRLVDVVFAIYFVLTSPVQLLLFKNPFTLFKNAFMVLAGLRTWIGYSATNRPLPALRKGIIDTAGCKPSNTITNKQGDLIDFWYAQNYEALQDVKLILKNYRSLDV